MSIILFDVCNYYGTTLKYLLIFETAVNAKHSDYMVYNTLEDTQLVNFLNGCKSYQCDHFLFNETERREVRKAKTKQQKPEKSISQKTDHAMLVVYLAR